MDAHNVTSLLTENLGLLGATLAAAAVIRRGITPPQQGCQSCGGRGVKQCSLCYGKGYLSTPGYINFADPRQRRVCKRCDGSRLIECTACGKLEMRRRDGPAIPRHHMRSRSVAGQRVPELYGTNISDGTKGLPGLRRDRTERVAPAEDEDEF